VVEATASHDFVSNFNFGLNYSNSNFLALFGQCYGELRSLWGWPILGNVGGRRGIPRLQDHLTVDYAT